VFGYTWFILKDSINLVILNSFHSLVSINFKTIVIIIITVIVAIYVDSVIIFSGCK
jgi:hypothetical protein